MNETHSVHTSVFYDMGMRMMILRWFFVGGHLILISCVVGPWRTLRPYKGGRSIRLVCPETIGWET